MLPTQITNPSQSLVFTANGQPNPVRTRYVRIRFTTNTLKGYKVKEIFFFGHACNMELYKDESSITPGTYCEQDIDKKDCPQGFYCPGT